MLSMGNADTKELTALSDEMKAAIGRSVPTVTYEVCGQGIRTFARAVGYGNPIYYSEEAARARGRVALRAPPGFLGLPVLDPSAPAARRPAFASLFRVGRLLDELTGDRGRVVRWKVSYRGMDEAGHELRVWGRVKKKYLEGDEGRLDLDVGVTGPDGRESTPGMATVVLPRSRAAEAPAT